MINDIFQKIIQVFLLHITMKKLHFLYLKGSFPKLQNVLHYSYFVHTYNISTKLNPWTQITVLLNWMLNRIVEKSKKKLFCLIVC